MGTHAQEHPARCTARGPAPFALFSFFFFLKAGELPAALSSTGAKPLEEAEV